MTEGGPVHAELFRNHGWQFRQFAVSQSTFECLERMCRLFNKGAGQSQRLVENLLLRSEGDVCAPTHQLAAAVRPGGHHHLGCQSIPELLAEDEGRSKAGREAVFREDCAVQTLLRHHDHICIQAKDQPTTGCMPLDRGDHRH